eukprot:c12143_g1_i1.p1 GENE.c12143_g1_i1~~c12143_g1_i1.p1  ORF type:complete len:459 (+),score=133.24 c12143_g1_i1:63-1439(+)
MSTHQRLIDQLLASPPLARLMNLINEALKNIGVEDDFITGKHVVVTILVGLLTLAMYFVLFGLKNRRSRKRLERELAEARAKVHELESQLEEKNSDSEDEKKEIRIFMDGAFDVFHYGHMNAFRQGRALGTFLVVGINSDESITECKGTAPVLNDEERTGAVAGCKFVDVVEPGCPYIMNEKYLRYVIDKYNIDYVVHGDDPCIVNGKDVYEVAQKMGKYRTIPRTEGISTTDIVGRMLLMSTDHHDKKEADQEAVVHTDNLISRKRAMSGATGYPRSQFLTTGRMIRLFSQGFKDPKPEDKVVYMDGSWDLFHAGHVEALKAAKAHGDYLIVGVHSDVLVNKRLGGNLPIMNLNERVLSVLGCRYVDDVLIDAPWHLTREMIASLNIHTIATPEMDGLEGGRFESDMVTKHVVIPTRMMLTREEIVRRIHENQEKYQKKFEAKSKAEGEYYKTRYGL